MFEESLCHYMSGIAVAVCSPELKWQHMKLTSPLYESTLSGIFVEG